MIQSLASAREALAAYHPALPWLCITAATWAGAWAVRAYRPALWLRLFGWVPADAPALFQDAATAIVLGVPGAILAAGASGLNPVHAVIGLAAGALATPVHRVVKACPWVPYRGALRLPGAP
jgi:hypothetical protein